MVSDSELLTQFPDLVDRQQKMNVAQCYADVSMSWRVASLQTSLHSIPLHSSDTAPSVDYQALELSNLLTHYNRHCTFSGLPGTGTIQPVNTL